MGIICSRGGIWKFSAFVEVSCYVGFHTVFRVFFLSFFFVWPRIGALIVFGYMLLFSTYNDSLRGDQSVQNVFIGNYIGRRKIIPTIHLQRAAEDIRCSESALGIIGIWVRFA